MKILILYLLLACTIVNCEHLILGHAQNQSLIYHTVAEYSGFPLLKREKHIFYNSPDQRAISSIIAYDRLHSQAQAQVTAGGIGYTYANIHLESERGKGLDYDIGIYA